MAENLRERKSEFYKEIYDAINRFSKDTGLVVLSIRPRSHKEWVPKESPPLKIVYGDIDISLEF